MEDPEMVVVLTQLSLGIHFITCRVWDNYKLKGQRSKRIQSEREMQIFYREIEGKHLRRGTLKGPVEAVI